MDPDSAIDTKKTTVTFENFTKANWKTNNKTKLIQNHVNILDKLTAFKHLKTNEIFLSKNVPTVIGDFEN
jgi:hypothetical protein